MAASLKEIDHRQISSNQVSSEGKSPINLAEARAARLLDIFSREPILLYPNAFNVGSVIHPRTGAVLDIGRVRERPVSSDGKVLDDGRPDETNLYLFRQGHEPQRITIPMPEGYLKPEDPRLDIEDGKLSILLTGPRLKGWYPYEVHAEFTDTSISDPAKGKIYDQIQGKNYTHAFKEGKRFVRFDNGDLRNEHRLYLVVPTNKQPEVSTNEVLHIESDSGVHTVFDGLESHEISPKLEIEGILDIPIVPWNRFRSGTVGKPIFQEDGSYIQFIHGIQEFKSSEKDKMLEYSIGAMRYRYENGIFTVLEMTQQPLMKPADFDDVAGANAQAIPGKRVIYSTDTGIPIENEEGIEEMRMLVSVGDKMTIETWINMDKVREKLSEGTIQYSLPIFEYSSVSQAA